MSEFIDVERLSLGTRGMTRKSSKASLMGKRKSNNNGMLSNKVVLSSWERNLARGMSKAPTHEQKLVNEESSDKVIINTQKVYDHKIENKDLIKFHAAFRIIIIMFVICVCLLAIFTIWQFMQQKMNKDDGFLLN